jgi:hypothetical protein
MHHTDTYSHAAVCVKQIQLERRKVLMLQQQLEQLTNKLGTTRSAMGSIFSAKEKTQALQKQIKILENRLEKQYIKYNEVCVPQIRHLQPEWTALGTACAVLSTHSVQNPSPCTTCAV